MRTPAAMAPIRWHPFRNDSGVTIPPFALLKITGVDDQDQRRFFTVDQPDGSPESFYAVNSQASVEATAFGAMTLDTPAYVLYDTGDGTPTVGQDWGAGSGSWKLRTAESGFIILGDANNGRVLAHQPGGVSSDPGIIPIELTGNMSGTSPDRAADGKQLEWSGSAYAVTGSTLSFTDPFDQFYAGKTGYQGHAYYNAQRAEWEILSLQHLAKGIRFELAGTLTTGDGSIASTDVLQYWDGLDPGSTVTVFNMPTSTGGVYLFSGVSGAIGYADYDDVNEQYKIKQMECPP